MDDPTEPCTPAPKREDTLDVQRRLLIKYRPWITEVFLAALGIDGDRGFQCELGFGNCTTRSFQADTLSDAVLAADAWVQENKP